MSNLRLKATDYPGLDRFLGSRPSRTIGYMTEARRSPADNNIIDIFHHGSLIVSLFPYGQCIITTAGWNTPTTRNRLNILTPDHVHVYQKNHQLRLSTPADGDRPWDGHPRYIPAPAL